MHLKIFLLNSYFLYYFPVQKLSKNTHIHSKSRWTMELQGLTYIPTALINTGRWRGRIVFFYCDAISFIFNQQNYAVFEFVKHPSIHVVLLGPNMTTRKKKSCTCFYWCENNRWTLHVLTTQFWITIFKDEIIAF